MMKNSRNRIAIFKFKFGSLICQLSWYETHISYQNLSYTESLLLRYVRFFC